MVNAARHSAADLAIGLLSTPTRLLGSVLRIWRSADVEGDPVARAARFGIVRSAAAASTRGSRATLLMTNRQLID